MNKWVKGITESLRFNLAWMARHRAEKRARWDELLVKYPAEALIADAQARSRSIKVANKHFYEARYTRYDDALRQSKQQGMELVRIQALLSRDYGMEIRHLKDRKVEIKQRHEAIKRELGPAYQSLKEANEDVASWHRKSKRSVYLFGNKGRKLPDHAIFGQSMGDLSASKDDRDSAWKKVESLKNERDKLSTEFGEIDAKADRIRADESECQAFRNKGHTWISIATEIKTMTGRVTALQLRQRAATRRKPKQLQRKLEASGVLRDFKLAAAMKETREQEFKAFLADQEVAQRRQQFRSQWDPS